MGNMQIDHFREATPHGETRQKVFWISPGQLSRPLRFLQMKKTGASNGAIDFLGGVSGDVMHFYLESGAFYQLLQQATANAQALIPLTSSDTNADSIRVLKIGRERPL